LTCMHKHWHTHTYSYTHARMHAHTHTHMHIHTHAHMHACTRVKTHSYAHKYTHMHTRAHTRTRTLANIQKHPLSTSLPPCPRAHAQPKDLASLLAVPEADAKRLMDREPLLSSHPVGRLKRTLKELSATLHVSEEGSSAARPAYKRLARGRLAHLVGVGGQSVAAHPAACSSSLLVCWNLWSPRECLLLPCSILSGLRGLACLSAERHTSRLRRKLRQVQ